MNAENAENAVLVFHARGNEGVKRTTEGASHYRVGSTAAFSAFSASAGPPIAPVIMEARPRPNAPVRPGGARIGPAPACLSYTAAARWVAEHR
jgi:hypothetical protein